VEYESHISEPFIVRPAFGRVFEPNVEVAPAILLLSQRSGGLVLYDLRLLKDSVRIRQTALGILHFDVADLLFGQARTLRVTEHLHLRRHFIPRLPLPSERCLRERR
jgi:hypothetical protein